MGPEGFKEMGFNFQSLLLFSFLGFALLHFFLSNIFWMIKSNETLPLVHYLFWRLKR